MIYVLWALTIFGTLMSMNDFRLRTPFNRVWWGHTFTAAMWGVIAAYYITHS